MMVPLTTGPTRGIRPINVGVQAFVRVVRRSRNCVSGFSKVGLLVIDFLTDSLVQVSNSGGNRKGCCCICSISFTQAREEGKRQGDM